MAKLIFGSQKYCTTPYDFSLISLNINVSLILLVTLAFHLCFQKCHCLNCLSHQNLEAQVLNTFANFFRPLSAKLRIHSFMTVGTSRSGIGVLLPLVNSHHVHLHLRTASSSEPGASYPCRIFPLCAGPRVN